MVSLSHLRSVIFKLFWSLPPAAEGRASGGKKRHEEKAWNASRRRWSRCTLGPLAAGLEAEEGRKKQQFKKNGPPLERPNLFFVQQLWVFKISSFKKEKVGWGGGEIF